MGWRPGERETVRSVLGTGRPIDQGVCPERADTRCLCTSKLTRVAQARPDLSIQDVTALLVSLTNLSLSCYPDRLEYVDQVLGFARNKIQEYADRYVDSSFRDQW